MIIIDCQPIEYRDGYKNKYEKPIVCPECESGLAMWKYGYRKRKVRDFQGHTYWINLPRYRCPICGKMFLTLPTFLLPYKQYDKSTIAKVQNGKTAGCGASYLSIYLWTRAGFISPKLRGHI